jgi:hypothetical protein
MWSAIFFFLAVNPTKVSGDSTNILANFDTEVATVIAGLVHVIAVL